MSTATAYWPTYTIPMITRNSYFAKASLLCIFIARYRAIDQQLDITCLSVAVIIFFILLLFLYIILFHIYYVIFMLYFISCSIIFQFHLYYIIFILYFMLFFIIISCHLYYIIFIYIIFHVIFLLLFYVSC